MPYPRAFLNEAMGEHPGGRFLTQNLVQVFLKILIVFIDRLQVGKLGIQVIYQ